MGLLGAALDKHNSTGDKRVVPFEDPKMKRNTSFNKSRDVSYMHPPYSLSRSLGPFQGTPPVSQFRPPVLASRGSDPLEPLPGQRGIGRSSGSSVKSSISSSIGLLVASSPPRSNNIGQKVRITLRFRYSIAFAHQLTNVYSVLL